MFPRMDEKGQVSIPLWFDWNQRGFRDITSMLSQVSIPLWFDWNLKHSIVFVYWTASLNSIMVRLKCKDPKTGAFLLGMSQFHYGSIEISLRVRNRDGREPSQFHYGSIEIATSIALSPFTSVKSQFHYGSIEMH